jgi:hypothetical protein
MSKMSDKLDYIIYELTRVTNDLNNLNKELYDQEKVIKAREVADLKIYNVNKLLDNGGSHE